MNDKSNVGIKQQIQAASSLSQINALLAKIRGYTHAQPKTLRKCERVAAIRAEQLACLGINKIKQQRKEK